ncbi:tRNA pseudouridine(55) synthase TruB [Algirhabdus cladophorae]|uniref:tRNA pseudouridine(55) synthase TruB n=1 Tax=Algirhabdus cladophorae TaxID=3377108 RepID=UPI003B8454D2
MGRKRKGRPVSGWVIIDKPAGITSTSVVNKVRWAFNAQKAGHAGTLDPEATGILAVALGEATKTVPYITDALKAYEFMVNLGAATNTDDAEGEVIARSNQRPSDAELTEALHGFIGDIQQVPPQFSAVRVDGQRAYALARKGEEMALAERDLYVDELILLDRPNPDTALLRMVCGKGGYVRSIARDLGEDLGCLGHVAWLRRLWSGPFDIADAVTLDQIDALAKDPAIDQFLQPTELGLADVTQVHCPATSIAALRNGNPAQVIANDVDYGDTVWACSEGQAIAVGIYKAGQIHPTRVFVPSANVDV